jgi:hypothetical protein
MRAYKNIFENKLKKKPVLRGMNEQVLWLALSIHPGSL